MEETKRLEIREKFALEKRRLEMEERVEMRRLALEERKLDIHERQMGMGQMGPALLMNEASGDRTGPVGNPLKRRRAEGSQGALRYR